MMEQYKWIFDIFDRYGLPLLILGFIGYGLYKLVPRMVDGVKHVVNTFLAWGGEIVDSHKHFLETAEKTQTQNADSISRLTGAIEGKGHDHTRTHEALIELAEAGHIAAELIPEHHREKAEAISAKVESAKRKLGGK